jgi:hypothetical protein
MGLRTFAKAVLSSSQPASQPASQLPLHRLLRQARGVTTQQSD